MASDFSLVSEASGRPDWQEFAKRFPDASARRGDLLRAVGITAACGAQELDGSLNGKDTPWSEGALWSFAQELEQFDIDANAAYYQMKNSVKS